MGLADRSLPTKAYARSVNRVRPDANGNVAIGATDLSDTSGTPSDGDTFIYNSTTNVFEYGAPSESAQLSQWWELGVAGATTVLVDQPVRGKAVVSLNGLVQRDGVEFSISGRDLSVLADMESQVGDILEITYHPSSAAADIPAAESPTSTVTVVNDSSHNAFPGLTMADNGDYIIVYRAGPGHGTGDGTIEMKRSTDQGTTWSSASTVASIAGNDARDPTIARTAYGLLVPYFEYTGSAFPSLRLSRSTDNGTSWSEIANLNSVYGSDHACSGPIVTAADGALLWPTYGNEVSGTNGIVKVLRSTNGGTTWAVHATLSDASRELVEPNIAVLSDGSLLMLIRSDTGADAIFSATSTDNGATWTTPVAAFIGSGRPAVFELYGTVHVMYRSTGPDLASYRTSTDGGVTWSAETTLTTTGAAYVYGQWADTGGLVPSVVWAEETSLSDSDVFFRRVPF